MSNPVQHDGYLPLEEWLNWTTHGVAAVMSVVAMVVLVVMASANADVWQIVSFSVYGASMTLLFLASALYHAARRPGPRKLFKLLDHCAIFLLIAGTYTPFLLVNMRGPTGWTLFGVIWGLAIAGITLKLVFGNRFHVARVLVYLLMGWLVVLASGELAASVNAPGLWLVIAGGITYTLGVVFYLIQRIPFNHAIWHLFVIGGSTCHFFAIYFGVLHGSAL